MIDLKTERALKVIAVLYAAMEKEAWEPGPTIDEAQTMAHDWYYNEFGYEGKKAASTVFSEIGLRLPEKKARKAK